MSPRMTLATNEIKKVCWRPLGSTSAGMSPDCLYMRVCCCNPLNEERAATKTSQHTLTHTHKGLFCPFHDTVASVNTLSWMFECASRAFRCWCCWSICFDLWMPQTTLKGPCTRTQTSPPHCWFWLHIFGVNTKPMGHLVGPLYKLCL